MGYAWKNDWYDNTVSRWNNDSLVDNTNPIPFLVCKYSTSSGSNAKHFLMT